MSFRIDDILKRESSENRKDIDRESPPFVQKEVAPKDLVQESSKDISKSVEPAPVFGLTPDSILHQSLLNRQLGYYRSAMDYQNLRLLPNMYCDKMYMPYGGSYDPYMDKVSAFSNVCSRTRFWSMYPHPVVLPLPYTHYSKRKGGQVRFTASQTDTLEKRFNSNKYLSPEDRRVLADSLKLTDRQVKTWFQNRRAKWRRCNSISSNSQLDQNDSESEPEICDDTPEHEKIEINN
ncbi:hematopoietically-expressed homeobox protein HHEX homolog [Onthophagus taurus]|uniref:hematopoietically-expressed homeobox protein HHEX homolog n=1 Tax=Onthophagus taurus TaxID=166361 RepID=UPI000C20DEA8|nr:hematopoietically-expressed homeobox protein HHEX homolog [Onthophagus taurus]